MVERLAPKVAMIGMDAAELSFIRRHLTSLPALRRLFEAGTLHHLRSTAEAFSGSVWPTFYSGLLPGDHGIYHHLQWDPGGMRLRRVSDQWLYVEPFWYHLERCGLRVATIDVPMSFPSQLTRGAEVINWGSHDELGSFHAHPGDLAAEMRRMFGRHPMGSEIPVRKNPAQLDRVRRNLVAGAKLKGAVSRWLLAQADWDFFLTVFGETHRGGHLLWPQRSFEDSGSEDALLDVYRAVDCSIGELVEVMPKEVTTLILFALHGMGRNDSQEHFMPQLMDRVNTRFLANYGAPSRDDGRSRHNGQRSVMRILREHIPPGLQNAIARAVPVGVRDLVVSRQITAGHNWNCTPGIALLADLNGYLRWNLRGREYRGMLEGESEMAERYIAWVRRCLMGLRGPGGGSQLVRDVLLIRDHFPGRRMWALPDAVVIWSGLPPASRVDSDEIGSLAAQPSTGRAGNHRPEGFCLIVERASPSTPRIVPPSHISDLSRFVCETLSHSGISLCPGSS